MKRLLLACGTFLAVFLSSVASSQIVPLQYYSTRDGLIANGITSLVQDSRGYIWIGTGEGLSVYDGESFTTYRTSEGLALNYVTTIIESRTHPGTMYVATLGGGISRFAGGKWTTISLDSGLAANQIGALLEDSRGVLWCGTSAGVYCISNGGSIKFQLPIKTNEQVSIVEASDTSVWIGYDRLIVLYSLSDSTTTMLDMRKYIKGEITCIFVGKDGDVWVCSDDRLVTRIRERKIIGQRNMVLGYAVCLFEEENGTLWFCSDNGLFKINKEQFASGVFTRYSTTNGLVNNNILAAMVDREGNLWFGGGGQGVSKWTERRTFSFPFTPVTDAYVHPGAVTDSAGHIWAVSGEGLAEFWHDEHEWHQHVHQPGRLLKQSSLSSLRYDTMKRLWVEFASGDIRAFRIVSQANAPSILAPLPSVVADPDARRGRRQGFFVDSKNQVWSDYPSDKIVIIQSVGQTPLKTLTINEGIPSEDIRDFYEDAEGNIWLAGVSGGVSVFSNNEQGPTLIRRVRTSDGLPDERVRCIMQDSHGRMWIGTRFGGLAVLDGGTIRHLSIADGLLSTAVWWCAEDHRGFIWVATQLGLQKVDLATLNPLPDPQGLRGETVITCGVTPNGVAWGYSPSMLTVTENEPPRAGIVPPPVYITGLQVNATAVDLTTPLDFDYDRNTFTFHFAGLSFAHERAVRYEYRLRDVETDWLPRVAERSVTYAQLNPGTYTFEVRAINSGGTVSTEPARLTISIAPPYWQTWWFRISIALIGGAALWMFSRYRLSKLLEMERTRTRIARDLHDELGSTLSSISYFARAMQAETEKKEGTQRLLSLITESASEAKASIGDIVWAIDPANDSWEKLSAKMRRYASDLLESKSIRYDIRIPESMPAGTFTMERRRNFWMIFKEMVINAAKHSHCKQIRIQLTVGPKTLSLSVEDDGIGFDPAVPSEGNGVKNIQTRAKQLNAVLDLGTAPGKGTRWNIMIEL